MSQYFRCLLAEFKKRNRSLFLLLHLVIPLVLSGIWMTYISARKDLVNPQFIYVTFFELLAIGTPLIISIICGMVSDSEDEAGNFQNMLGVTKKKTVTFISQISMMILSYFFAILLAISTYTLALKYLVGVDEINFALYFLNGLIFTMCSIFLYFFYQVIGYKYGMGMCSIGGFAGLIIAALSITSIGDKVWIFLPWAWPNRFSLYLFGQLENHQSTITDNYTNSTIVLNGCIILFIFTVIIIIISIFWFKNWYGRKAND
ncbi:lantibiotic immunity ABC transporter MutG family permease subunit [Bacillus paranthracis]|uniref:Lantibiotic immunity ABC transporter MutG family permease subunit n=1 Tax=Bacillus paranthracis TaxID=2026186 RepID=A0AAJ1K4T1_9BACI|nr:lantibiotic immunity ABC transporter MutG family permease subunit [Bacillus paranthracis]MDG0949139.1 lantibiotic immunity ABC transporter MutG family permease subunit [Bacillus paranthracis]MDG0954756.1 lantibiotic immunity ABC transporter MutG family permease subunit [Bacillus paranthracis]